MFHQAFGPFQYHIRYLNMILGRLVKGRGHYFCCGKTLHIRHFFWPFIYQQDYNVYFRIISSYALSDFFVAKLFYQP